MSESDRPPFVPPGIDYVECHICGRIIDDFSRVEGMDISPDEQYYPDMVPICRDGNHRDPDVGRPA